MKHASGIVASFLVMASASGTVLAQGAAAGPEPQLDEVVVTARRAEERLQDVPLSVAVLTAKDLIDRNVRGLQDIAALTPGLNFEDYIGGNGTPVIRGASQNRITDLDQNVSTFFDGIYLPRQYVLNTGVLGLERVEVVKGPQSALYGRNAFMGAINYVTRKPGEELRAEVEATLGNNERRDVLLDVSGPLIGDKLFGRIGFGYSEFDGDANNSHPNAGVNIDPGSPGRLGGWERQSLQARLVFRPIDTLEFDLGAYRFDIFEETRAVTRLQRSTNDLNCSRVGGVNRLYCGEIPTAFTPLPGSPARGDVVMDPRAYGLDLESTLLRGHAEWRARDNLNFVYEYGKLNSVARSAGTSDRDPVLGQANFLNAMAPRGNQVQASPNGDVAFRSNELRIEYSPREGLDLLVGYIELNLRDFDFFPIAGGIPLLGTDPINLNGPEFIVLARGRNIVDTRGIFARANWKATDRLRVGIEARQQDEDKTLVSGPTTFNNAVRTLSDTWSDFTPRVTLDYKLAEQNLVYATAAKGVKSGGFNLSALLPEQFRYEQDENWTYELGSKNTLLDGRLRLNAAVFRIDWSNQQVNCSASGSAAIQPPAVICNQGDATINGLEVDGSWALTRGVRLNFGLTYNDATYGDGAIADRAAVFQLCDGIACPRDGSIAGNQLNRQSRLQALAGISYEVPLGNSLGFFTNFDASYKGKQYVDEMNVGYIPARTLANLRLGVRTDRWEVAAWSNNLFDEVYASAAFYTTAATDTVYIPIRGQRRIFGLTGRFTF